MKKLFAIFCSLLVVQLVAAQDSKKQQDIQSIKDMCGCYEVTFNFSETFSPDTAYKFHENYRSGGLEWVTVASEADDYIALQHLLIVGDTMIIKHWRQDWLYENPRLYTYHAGNTWKYVELPEEEVTGQWTQKVYQVDDSPRYEGTATWVHYDGRHYWENTANAPLPRREFSKRSDYNLMERRNRHEITAWGHVHEQDNDKVLRSEAGDELIAAEKGMNTYRKVEDSRCQPAEAWWAKNQEFWSDVRFVWDEIFDRNQDMKLQKVVDGKPLFMHLFPLGDELVADENYSQAAARDAIREVIDKFMVE